MHFISPPYLLYHRFTAGALCFYNKRNKIKLTGKYWKLGDYVITNSILHEEYDNFKQNIKYYRKKLNLTQEDLAEKADLSISYIKQIESNKEFKNVSFTVILKLSKALNVSVDKLFVIKVKNS